MSFSRKSLYGTDFSWFALDENNSIALFISGYAPIPSAVFRGSRKHYDNSVSPIFDLHIKYGCASVLTDSRKIEQDSEVADYSDHLEYASNGIYVYEDDRGLYKLVAYPDKPIGLDTLRMDTKIELLKIKFEEIEFENSSSIRVEDFVDCDE